MSHPGRLFQLPLGTCWPKGWLAIADTLLDHEVSFAVVGEDKSGTVAGNILAATKARSEEITEADYIFVIGTDSQEASVRSKRGTLEYPDRSA